jgi:fido (protein-threonine AMPylation protein)
VAKAEVGGTEPPNRFARRYEELSAQERPIAEGALAAATATFATFQDAPQSHYYRAPDLSPEETWQAVTAEVGRVTAIAAVEAASGGFLSDHDFGAIHEAIFAPVFGEETLAQRKFEEGVTYGIVLGRPDRIEHRIQHGISGRSLPGRLREISRDLRRAIEESDEAVAEGTTGPIIDATRPAARAYGRFLGAHPYVDGNGRTAFPILNFALIRLGLLAIAVPESEMFHWCLGRCMRRKGGATPEPLATHLAEIIRNSQ